MPDENGTEATRSDASSADESLFGDPADDTGVETVQEKDSNNAVYDEQDAGKQNAQDAQGSDDAGEQAVGDKTETAEDLKVVVSIKGGRATIGVQRPASDPHIETFDDLEVSGLAQEIPAVVERARARWQDAPKHPAYARPAPPARRRNRLGRGSAQETATAEGGTEQQTLRLF